MTCDQAFHGAGACVDSFPWLLGICVVVFTGVIAFAWRELRDVIADIRAARARKQLRIVAREVSPK